MTKPEPLKGKVYVVNNSSMCFLEDIRSAVEWERDMKYLVWEAEAFGYINKYESYVLNQCIETKAFEDVMKDA